MLFEKNKKNRDGKEWQGFYMTKDMMQCIQVAAAMFSYFKEVD